VARNPEPPGTPPGDGVEAAVLQWVRERDAVLRGLTHALSNRVGTVAAVAGMLAPGEPVSGPVAGALRDESARLEEVLALYRLLPLDAGAEPEPLFLPDLIPAVVELHSHNGAYRDQPVAVEGAPDAPPVLVPHSAFAQALLVLLAAGAEAGGAARLRWDGAAGGDRVALTVDAASPAVGAVAWLLGDSAAVQAESDGSATILLTTLAAARRGG
jgi:hypothetical protein